MAKEKNKDFQKEVLKMHISDFFESILGLLIITAILACLCYTTYQMIQCAIGK